MARILIVDDSPTTAQMNKAALEEEGHEVFLAFDGEEGLKKARETMPELVVLDVMLPKMDGFSVCRLLKFDEKFSRIPVILLTAKASDKDKQTGLGVGADEYMVKDEGFEALVGLVRKHLKKT